MRRSLRTGKQADGPSSRPSTKLTNQLEAQERAHAMAKKSKALIKVREQCFCSSRNQWFQSGKRRFFEANAMSRKFDPTNLNCGGKAVGPPVKHGSLSSRGWKAEKSHLGPWIWFWK